ncbi:hypothetical protein LEP1GSC052_0783 [Leptospira kmetyi serovar Malaysia str. Bejo-Iso9]|nr:hypothetical protein LEP1GSC052_0783 [Leptospira kmetyi serovar Malaysia str. Bejo-Iso9]
MRENIYLQTFGVFLWNRNVRYCHKFRVRSKDNQKFINRT